MSSEKVFAVASLNQQTLSKPAATESGSMTRMMHQEHLEWLNDVVRWRDDLAQWQSEIREVQKWTAELQKVLDRQISSLVEQSQVLLAHSQQIITQEYVRAKYEKGIAEKLLGTSVETYQKQSEQHERLKTTQELTQSQMDLMLSQREKLHEIIHQFAKSSQLTASE